MTELADSAASPRKAEEMPTFGQAARVWLRVGLLSFGGPAGQIALMHREVVDERRWVSDRRFLHALNFCTLLPGPEAQQLATYLGWLMHGVRGGLTAGLLFIVPGALVMLALSIVYATLGDVKVVGAVFFGLKSAVLVLVIEALLRVGRRALKGPSAWMLAAVAFVALFFFAVPFPVVVLVAGAIGWIAPARFSGASHGRAADGPPAAIDAALAADPGRAVRFATGGRRAAIVALAAWLLPVALLILVGGVFGDIAWFFSKMAVVTFGGAYAVLVYVAQEAVQSYGWLSAPDMLTGLGLAETTPGPLILVLEFVGFMAGYRSPGALAGLLGGAAAAALTLWVTFAPCFLFVFLGAPMIERVQNRPTLSGAMAAITAAVAGVIGNLAIWFALHSLFRLTWHVHAGPLAFDAPVVSSLDPWALLLAAGAGFALLRLRIGVLPTLAGCACAGIALHLVFGVT